MSLANAVQPWQCFARYGSVKCLCCRSYSSIPTQGSVSFPQGITESFGAAIHALNASHLTDGVIYRSKRMMLDTLGVGLLGTRTDVFNKAMQYSQV